MTTFIRLLEFTFEMKAFDIYLMKGQQRGEKRVDHPASYQVEHVL